MSGPSNISGESSSFGGNYRASEQAELSTSKTRHKQRSSNRSTIQNGSNQVEGAPESKLSPMSRKVIKYDKYSRKGGRWSWKRPSFERDVVSLVKAERKLEEDISASLTEVEVVEAGLRYFDELLVPQSAKRKSRPSCVEREEDRPGHPSLEWRLQKPSPELQTGKSSQQGERFPNRSPGGTKRSLLVSRGGLRNEGKAARSMDLKLTLRQRLENYDRQRGINTHQPSDGDPVPLALPPNGKKESINASRLGCRSTQPRYDEIYGSITGSDAIENPAPYEGGALDRVGVQNILARSLGNAMMAVRRTSKGGHSTRGRLDPRDGGGRLNNDRSAARLRWRSWQEPPPFVLASARKMKERALKQGIQGSDRESGDAASRSQGEETERGKEMIASGNANANGYARGVLTTEDQGTLGPPSASDVVLTDSTTNGTAHPSASESSSSGKASRRGAVLLVPRVATLAADIISARKKLAEEDSRSLAKARRTKDFDPDKLECVRRHEASVADRERRVQSLRTKAEHRSRFRARPLPSFLLGNKNGGVGGGMSSGEDIPSWIDAVGADRDLLLAALKQDHEAQELVKNTTKMNKHMGFASILLSSKSPPSMATALTNHVLRHAASRGPTASAGYHLDFSKAVRGKRADSDSKSGSLHHPTHQQEDASTRWFYDEERGNLINVERNHAREGTAEPDVSQLTTVDVIKGERRVGGTPRSLMGRMLGSGMLERQREWANERMRKILELRRKEKEVKEQEVKKTIFEADVGERSWANAKMKHLVALERHKAEEETREQLREASLRASAARARREREAAEKAAIALAAKLGEAEKAAARESRTVPTSKEESRKSRKPVSPPRRSKSQTDDGAVSKATADPEEVGLRRSHRRRRIQLSCSAAPSASLVENLSEDDFYRVAVEKIIEKSGGSAGDAKQEDIEDNTINQTLATPGAFLCHEDHSPGRRKARDAVPVQGIPHNRAGRFARRSVRHGHDSKSTPAYKPSAPARLTIERNTSDRRGRRRRAPDALGSAVEQLAKTYSVAGLAPPKRCGDGSGSYTLPLSGSRKVGPNSSLLSLFEAQSVEHCTDTGSFQSARESYLEGSTVEGNEQLGNRRGQRKENTDAAFTSVRGQTYRELYRSSPSVTTVHGVALGEYPWSEENLSRSPGSGTVPGSQTELNFVSSNEMKEAPDGEPRWSTAKVDTWERSLRSTEDELLQCPAALVAKDNKGEEKNNEISGGVGPRRPRGVDEFKSDCAKMRQSTTSTAAIVADEGRFVDVVRVKGSDSGDHGNPQPSSFDDGPYAAERTKAANKDGTKATAQRFDDDIVDRRERDQLSPESSFTKDLREYTSPDKTTVAVPRSRQPAEREEIRAKTLVGPDDGEGVLRETSGRFAPQGLELGAGERNADLETLRSIHQACDVEDERSSSASSLIGRLGQSFFDPTTSSADKGRFRVRDPRHFDPCSMRRTSDFVIMKSETADDNEVVGSLVGANDSCSVTEGVTLLKGRRIPEIVGGRRERDGQEEVITVMFDRSKFNEHEAQSWWSLNCARIMGDRARGSCVPHVVRY